MGRRSLRESLFSFMLLALDIGNTNIVIGVFRGAHLVAQWRLSTRRECTSDELAAFLQTAMQTRDLKLSDIRGVAVSSVVPSLTPQTVRLARDYFACEALVVGPKIDLGLINDYQPRGDVGADRLVNGMAAWKKFQGAVLIADLGTATTVDAVSRDGHYLGGAIAPGLQISTDALFRAAARLPRVEIVAPQAALGRTTVTSLQSGIVWGYVGLVKELIARCLPEVEAANNPGEKVAVIATGGLAELIAPHVSLIEHIEPNLTLEGLRLAWEMNTATVE
jgi:type III pantothenate kinase